MSRPTFLFAGGGSGGHLTPGLAVAEELRRRVSNARIVFTGPGRPIDHRMLADLYEHRPMPTLSPASGRRHPLRLLKATWKSWQQAQHLLNELQPAAIIGLGGFASVPCASVAARRKVPLILLEQNVIPGRATSWLSRRSTAICTSFDDTVSRLPRSVRRRVFCTGNPLMNRSMTSDAISIHHESWMQAENRLLILGGSLGARGLNELLRCSLPALKNSLSTWKILHQSGTADAALMTEFYIQQQLDAEVVPFLTDVPALQRNATLVASRAGGTTLAELAANGCPSLLVPLPRCVRDHQRHNARFFVKHEAAVMTEEHCGATKFAEYLKALLTNSELRRELSRRMANLGRPDAAAAICDTIQSHAAL